MPILEIKILVVSLCAALKLVGELWWHNAQRWIMPAVLGVGVSLVCNVWWLGLLVYPCCVPIDLGYKFYGKSGGFDRGAWLFAICLVAGLGVTLTHHLPWAFYAPWCLLMGAWGATTRNLLNWVIAPFTGAFIGLMVFFVK